MDVKDIFKNSGRVFTFQDHSDSRLPYQFLALDKYELVDHLPVFAADDALFSFIDDGDIGYF
jgi:hypothetical protein